MRNHTKPPAWIIPVRSTRLGDIGLVLVCYAAGFADPGAATEAVRKHLGQCEGTDIGEPSPMLEETAKALGIHPNTVRML
jgi:hypothetical protein